MQLRRKISHRGVKIHRAHGMTDHFGLLAHWLVRLAVFMRLLQEGGRIIPSSAGFIIKVMRWLFAALVDEIDCQIEMFFIFGQMIKLNQRQFDFLMPTIARLLVGAGPEDIGNVIDITLHDIKPASATSRQKIGNSTFQHVPGVIEFMIITQIGPALVKLAADVPEVQVSIRQLRLLKLINNGFNLAFDFGIAPMGQAIACGFNPFANIGIPEHLHSKIVLIARKPERWRRLLEFKRLKNFIFTKLFMLAGNGRAENCIQPLLPKCALKFDVVEFHW